MNTYASPDQKPIKLATLKEPYNTPTLLGLTSYERKILAAIAMPKKVVTIARHTNIPRTSLLYNLEKLHTRSLVEKMTKGKRTYWKATVDRSIRKLKQAIPLIETKYNGITFNEFGIVTYKGKKALFQIFENLADLPKGSRVYGIQPDSSIKYSLRKNDVKEWLRINKIIKEKGLVVEAVVHEKSVNTIISEVGKENAVNIFDSFVGRLEDYVKIPDEFADVESELYIFGGGAYIINWNKEIGIGIHDNHMTKLLLALFSCTKELGTRYSQNQKMESYKKVLKKK